MPLKYSVTQSEHQQLFGAYLSLHTSGIMTVLQTFLQSADGLRGLPSGVMATSLALHASTCKHKLDLTCMFNLQVTDKTVQSISMQHSQPYLHPAVLHAWTYNVPKGHLVDKVAIHVVSKRKTKSLLITDLAVYFCFYVVEIGISREF